MESSSSAGGWHWLRGLWPLSGSDLLQILVVTKGVRVAWIPTLGPRVLWGHFPWRPSGPTCRCHPTQPQWLNLFQHFKTPPQNQPPYAYYLFKMIPATSTKPLLDSPEQVLFPLPRTFFVYILTWLTYNNPSSSSWKVTSPRKPFLNSTPPPPPPCYTPHCPQLWALLQSNNKPCSNTQVWHHSAPRSTPFLARWHSQSLNQGPGAQVTISAPVQRESLLNTVTSVLAPSNQQLQTMALNHLLGSSPTEAGYYFVCRN